MEGMEGGEKREEEKGRDGVFNLLGTGEHGGKGEEVQKRRSKKKGRI